MLIIRRLIIEDEAQGLEFHRLLAKVFRIHGKIVFARLAPDGITQGQPRILRYLLEHDGCIQRDIASDNDLEPATVTNILALMEGASLVRRESAAEDRRVLRVYITPKGRKAFAKAEEAFGEAEELGFRGFSAREKKQAMAYLRRIYGNLKG